ncbi:MAG: hypothetical protein IKR25_06515 [Muribaculaceae bacterium]|nr:hypothetical protein [Muribaculaceae bacterium]
MRTVKRLLLVVATLLTCVVAWADSPLTSTDFAQAYDDHPMVQMASDFVVGAIFSEGDLPAPMVKFLTDKKSPIDVRLAVVNKMGWEAGWAMTLVKQCMISHCKARDEEQLMKKGDAATLIIYAYAKSLEDYFNVTDARTIAHEAVKKNKGKSFSIDFIASLIDSQYNFDNDMENIYSVVSNVINEYGDKQDMRTQAVNIVMDYISLYAE